MGARWGPATAEAHRDICIIMYVRHSCEVRDGSTTCRPGRQWDAPTCRHSGVCVCVHFSLTNSIMSDCGLTSMAVEEQLTPSADKVYLN